ncbi:hypothetical protein CVT26_015144 [Gymnopilus dilepis]|uniref:Uncharacterized protein n=1 Tax=Gymnopilus dilepis TaxID=231916 RepID=A0A409YEX5_9AGAR|nr:hypothetical protein CVT26_015144 [Gymnopilus dilepis]
MNVKMSRGQAIKFVGNGEQMDEGTNVGLGCNMTDYAGKNLQGKRRERLGQQSAHVGARGIEQEKNTAI